jgi:Polyketide cyclase / dehydrase and lipid transport
MKSPVFLYCLRFTLRHSWGHCNIPKDTSRSENLRQRSHRRGGIKMVTATLDVRINRRLEDFFPILSYLANRSKWESGVLRTKKISTDPISVSTEYLEVYQPLLTERTTRTIVVTEYEPNHNISYSYEGFPKFAKGTTTTKHSFASQDGSTELTVESKVALRDIFQLCAPLLAFGLRRQVKHVCDGMKELCEEKPRDDCFYGYSSLPVHSDLSRPLTTDQRQMLLELYKEICTSWRTAALFVYDRRNSQLHDDLISRGRRVEKELGIDTGHFLGRQTVSERLPILPLLPGISRIRIIPVSHRFGINLIYGTAIFDWLVTIVATWLHL